MVVILYKIFYVILKHIKIIIDENFVTPVNGSIGNKYSVGHIHNKADAKAFSDFAFSHIYLECKHYNLPHVRCLCMACLYKGCSFH